LFSGQKVQDFEALFWWSSCLAAWTETILSFPVQTDPEFAQFLLRIRMRSTSCAFEVTDIPLNLRRSRRVCVEMGG
jgi:hypothetical protein